MKVVDPKRMQMALTGFLEKKTGEFVEELWNLLVDAQSNPYGIPAVFLERKKEEMMMRRTQAAPPGAHTGGISAASTSGGSAAAVGASGERRSRFSDGPTDATPSASPKATAMATTSDVASASNKDGTLNPSHIST
jgi:hypothetical protein